VMPLAGTKRSSSRCSWGKKRGNIGTRYGLQPSIHANNLSMRVYWLGHNCKRGNLSMMSLALGCHSFC
jgi:hypothetical protein